MLQRATKINDKAQIRNAPTFNDAPSLQRKNQFTKPTTTQIKVFSLLEPNSNTQYTILSKRSIAHSLTSTSFTIPFTKFPLQTTITHTALHIPSLPKIPHSINNISFNIPSTPPISIPLSSHLTNEFTILFTKLQLPISITHTTLEIPSLPKIPNTINSIAFDILSTPLIPISLSTQLTNEFTIPFTKLQLPMSITSTIIEIPALPKIPHTINHTSFDILVTPIVRIPFSTDSTNQFTIPFTKLQLPISVTHTAIEIPAMPKIPYSINYSAFNIPSTSTVRIPLSTHSTNDFTIPFTKHEPKYNTSSTQQLTFQGTTHIPWNQTSTISTSPNITFIPSSLPTPSQTLSSPPSTLLDLSKLIPLYLSPTYLSFSNRTIFPLTLPSNFISSFITSLSSTLLLPITFYEPITTVQKPCEKFINSSYLHKAFITNSSLTSFPETLLHLCTFTLSEMTLNLKRFLFPLPSSQNETFSYFNTTHHYLYFAEHINNTTIYTAQSNTFSFYSTYTTNEHSFNCRINAIEYKDNAMRFINFATQQHVWYTYTLPTLYMKHVLLGKAYFVYEGDVVIRNNVNDAKCVIKFAKGNNGEYKGKIMNVMGEVVYEVDGVLGKYMDVSDNDKGKRRILDDKVYKGEMYLKNKIGKFHDYKYYLPLICYEFNNGRDILKDNKLIFNSDTRNRKDIISYEEGDISTAQEIFEQQQQQHTINSTNNTDITETNYFIKTTPSSLAYPIYQLKPSFISSQFPL